MEAAVPEWAFQECKKIFKAPPAAHNFGALLHRYGPGGCRRLGCIYWQLHRHEEPWCTVAESIRLSLQHLSSPRAQRTPSDGREATPLSGQ